MWIESSTPPVGRLAMSSEAPVAFVGWLDLLAQLSHLLDDPTEPEQEPTT